MSRIACILVADFSIAALVRANPALDGAVLAISHSLAPHAELVAVSPRARALGIRPGMTIAQARAISSELVVTARSPAAERSAHDPLTDAAESVSPVVEPGEPGCVWLDLAGLGRIHGSEEETAFELMRRVRRIGMEAAAGIAAGKEIAYLAARCAIGEPPIRPSRALKYDPAALSYRRHRMPRVIEPGREREFLDWLPLDVLGLGASEHGDDLEMTLARWGLRRLGDLARLDPDAIGSRLGRRGVELVRLAHGGSPAPLVARPHAEAFAEAVELEYGIDNLEAMGFVVRPMLERLVERLKLRGLVAGDIMLVLGHCGHRVASRRIAVAAPSNEVRAMLTLLMLSLESNPPGAAVESIRIEIQPRIPRPAQSDMFLPPAPAPDRLQTTIARLAALCGPGNVGALMPENSHRPEAVRLDPYDPPPPTPVSSSNGAHPRNGAATAAASNAARLVLRAIRPAMEVEVMSSRGEPEFVRGPNLGARVVSIAGPWRRDGEWWKCAGEEPRPSGAAGFIRDYYELALDDGGVYRAFCDLNSNRWFVDGVYD